ncbi:MAG: alpha/beta hydrolase [Alphaproteobacteria bacterium]|nr:alpha/beta hydrolase [Alphaproteobacteria bacterium]
MTIQYLHGSGHVNLAYVYRVPTGNAANLPAVMFLGGFCSDMSGTKATYLEERCAARGQKFVRFDYSGHGESDGAFADGTIGSWARDAMDILDRVVTGKVVLVGSSMGGWIALRLLLARPDRVAGVVGIAAAPDFTKDIEALMTEAQKKSIAAEGFFEVPNDYGPEPYVFTRHLLEDGRAQCVLGNVHPLSVPLTLVQGKMDMDVPWKKALAIEGAFPGAATKVIFVEDGDHRLSRPEDLALIDREVMAVSGL